jgi:homoserine O-succinyltransferase
MRIEQFTLVGGLREACATTVNVGLVNNMPDAALRPTELQFARLLKEAAGAIDVRLHLFSFSQTLRSDGTRARMQGFYADAALLPDAGLDALIVTGAEPRPGDMRDDPSWPALVRLIDWAESGTVSTLYSCLAAHAAVLHLDGIERRPLRQKLRGVFDCERIEEDLLLAGTRAVAAMPHSRRNEVTESDLVARGYRVLTRVPDGGVDMFTKPGRSLKVFHQGHPEYDADTLGREFLRDTGRFLRGETGERPAMPENYFDRATEGMLHELAGHAVDAGILPRYHAVVNRAVPLHSWRGQAQRLFANWLNLVMTEKSRRAAQRPGKKRALIASD